MIIYVSHRCNAMICCDILMLDVDGRMCRIVRENEWYLDTRIDFLHSGNIRLPAMPSLGQGWKKKTRLWCTEKTRERERERKGEKASCAFSSFFFSSLLGDGAMFYNKRNGTVNRAVKGNSRVKQDSPGISKQHKGIWTFDHDVFHSNEHVLNEMPGGNHSTVEQWMQLVGVES